MQIRRHAGAAEFLERAEPWLVRREAENNLAIGIARRNRGANVQAAAYWATVEQAGEVLGAAFRTPPHQVGLTMMPAEAVPLLVADIGSVYADLSGVGGPTGEARSFAATWADRRGIAWHLSVQLRLHILHGVRFPEQPPRGALRKAAGSDLPLVREWMRGFIDDTGMKHITEEFADRLVHAGVMYLWEDDGVRCMVAAGRDTPNGTCVNAVYTPPEHRRRGYAEIAVATLSQNILDAGKRFCCLYTDLANATSNAIYRRIGYEPVVDWVEIDFALSPGSYELR